MYSRCFAYEVRSEHQLRNYIEDNDTAIRKIAPSSGPRTRNMYAAVAPAPQEEQASGSSDVTEQIKKLAELRDQGILTDEEFQVKKKELLAKL
ncbi:MAG: SHOCT domain-containing protein [Halobacteriota archaeon]